MNTNRIQAFLSIIFAAVLALIAVAPASAHVGLKADTSAAGSTAILTFGFGHGCGESPTTAVSIQIPEEFNSVTPVLAPGWDIEVENEELATPIAGAHGDITERTTTVTFTADESVPDGIYGTVSLRMTLPEELAGESIFFPVIQSCEEGEHAWIEIPQDGEDADSLESPAPSITITEPEGDNGH